MQNALSTLPWVEADSIRTSTAKQQATIGFKNKNDWDEDAVRETIETKTSYKVGKVLSKPE